MVKLKSSLSFSNSSVNNCSYIFLVILHVVLILPPQWQKPLRGEGDQHSAHAGWRILPSMYYYCIVGPLNQKILLCNALGKTNREVLFSVKDMAPKQMADKSGCDCEAGAPDHFARNCPMTRSRKSVSLHKHLIIT